MQTCPFCQIDNVKNRTLQESEYARVIFSNPRLMKGHLLVLPKRHVEQPWELTKRERDEVLAHVNELQKKLSETLGTGCDVRQHYRPFMVQGRLKVNHVHYHLLPRTLEDELYQKSMKFETPMFVDVPSGEPEQVASLLGKNVVK